MAVARVVARPRRRNLAAASATIGACLVAAALTRYGAGADGLAWASVMGLLVFIAVFDIATRRIPNRVTVPAAAAVLVLRAGFEPSTLGKAALAGAIAFGALLLLAVLTRGGLGMGDVKLAALLGLMLGATVLPALLIGTIAGGIAAAAVLIARRRRGDTIAYGPYLCFGAAIAILALQPPPLV